MNRQANPALESGIGQMMQGKGIAPPAPVQLKPTAAPEVLNSGILNQGAMNVAEPRVSKPAIKQKVAKNIAQSKLSPAEQQKAAAGLQQVDELPGEMLMDFGTSLMQCKSPYFSDCLADATNATRAGKIARSKAAGQSKFLDAQIKKEEALANK